MSAPRDPILRHVRPETIRCKATPTGQRLRWVKRVLSAVGWLLAGYRFDNGLRLQLDVLNLFNANTNQMNITICRDYRASRSTVLPTVTFIPPNRWRFASR